MTYDERRQWFCAKCSLHDSDKCGFVIRGMQSKCADVQDFMRGWEIGQQDTIEEFERNRLAACDRQTPEEAQREQDFATAIIEQEHRQPTFDDAIKYGMQLQREQMMKDAIAVDLVVNNSPCGDDRYMMASTRDIPKKVLQWRNTDGAKIIIVKEDNP